MKSIELILSIDLDDSNDKSVLSIKQKLIDDGWILKIKEKSAGVSITLYESTDDLFYNDMMCKAEAPTYVEAVRKCLKKVQEYYRRVV